MAITLDDIKAYKTRYMDTIYSVVRSEQTTDKEYIEDIFSVPEIKKPHHIYRSGFGSRIVNAPAEQIITANPQVFASLTKGKGDAPEGISKIINEQWIEKLKRQSPNPFKESVKNQLSRGETFIQVVHNSSWVTKGMDKVGPPVHFVIPDPMVIYASPEEDEDGIPEIVIVYYQRQLMDVILKYPKWPNPLREEYLKDSKKLVSWFEFYSKDVRYFEADNEAVLVGGDNRLSNGNGIQENIYGFVPFARKRSGFGKRSPDGELASLIVSDIRWSRDLIREECAVRSNINSIDFLFAQAPHTFIGEDLDEEQLKKVSFGSYDRNVIPVHPKDIEIVKLDITPSDTMERHHSKILSELSQRHPLIMAGFPIGTSGRQQDLTQISGMRRYDSVVENTENLWATAFEMSRKIMTKVPGLGKAAGLTKSDMETSVNLQVRLRVKDPIEEDRKVRQGFSLWSQGQGAISLRDFLIDHYGKTEAGAKRTMARMLAERVTLFNPEIAALLGQVGAQEGGIERLLQGLQGQGGLLNQPTPSSQQRLQGEALTDLGREIGTPSEDGQRSPPRF